MPEIITSEDRSGLTSTEADQLLARHGKNKFQSRTYNRFLHIIWDVVKEPMFILLVIACSLYFILGEMEEGFMMLAAMFLVTAISVYQEVKSSHALNALKQLTQPLVTVIRDGAQITIVTENLVPGDIMLLNEGMKIPADGFILETNDFSVNESIITGESFAVTKQAGGEKMLLYQGTTVNSGKCMAQVTETGNKTVLGKLGRSVEQYHVPKTLLQNQINKLVRKLALFGLIGFFLIFLVNYFQQHQWASSLLIALTLAMSAVPEEIPVAFSSFMALGAFKMSRLGIISRQPQVVENLGAVSVICLDKTGTITENRMKLRSVYDFKKDLLIDLDDKTVLETDEVLRDAMLASEKNPFDEMEKAILEAFHLYAKDKSLAGLSMIHEYPLEGSFPMMTHIYETGGQQLAAAKGAAERILEVCRLPVEKRNTIKGHVKALASKGYRVIGTAHAKHDAGEYPTRQDDFNWEFSGLLALYDPPKQNVKAVLQKFLQANIKVKLLTGDYPETAINIAGQVGIPNPGLCVRGEEVMQMTIEELQPVLKSTNVFARMFPDAKLKVIDVLKKSGETVAMTGDGVNDAPALKSAHIGIAMGEKGTEIARQASDLVLTDDNLEKMVTAVREGRKIFNNLKKAVRYIISIHIPIILIASLPVLFGWIYPNIFTPIHVIFLELIMGPTCSIFFEQEPVESDLMLQDPRDRSKALFTKQEIMVSVFQGIIIASGTMILYFIYMKRGASLELTRTMVFTTLLFANLFLTFTNRSFSRNILATFRKKNKLTPFIIIISLFFITIIHTVPAVRELFKLTTVSAPQFFLCIGVALASVSWFEIYKIIKSGKGTG